MGKIRRGNYIFVWFIGDHSPPHIHVYRNTSLVLKWDLTGNRAMAGAINARLRGLIEELRREGVFNEIIKD